MKKVFVLLAAAIMMTVAAQAQKIGHFSQSELIALMPEYKTAEGKLKEHSEALQKTLEEMQKDLETKFQKYQTEAPKMTQTMKEVTEKELNEQNMRFQERAQKAEQELAVKEQELLKPIFEKLRTAINNVATKNGYDYILEKTSIHYAKDANDVSTLIKAELGIK